MSSFSDDIFDNLTQEQIEELTNLADNPSIKVLPTLYELSIKENESLKLKKGKVGMVKVAPEYEYTPPIVKEKPVPKSKGEYVSRKIDKENFNKDDDELNTMLENLSPEELNDLSEMIDEKPNTCTPEKEVNHEPKDEGFISIDDLIEKCKISNEIYLNLTSNHITYGIADKLFKYLSTPECTIETLIMANCQLSGIYMKEFSECLEKNKSIKKLNIETNRIEGSYLMDVFKSLFHHPSISELRIVNQSTVLGEAAEKCLLDLVNANKNIIKLTFDSRHRFYKDKIERQLMMNHRNKPKT